MIRVLRWGVLIFIVLSDVAHAQSGQLLTSTPVSTIVFGTTVADFIARVIGLNLYVSSVLSAGIHGAYPDLYTDPLKYRTVRFFATCFDAMSVNGKGSRTGSSLNVNAPPPPLEVPR